MSGRRTLWLKGHTKLGKLSFKKLGGTPESHKTIQNNSRNIRVYLPLLTSVSVCDINCPINTIIIYIAKKVSHRAI